MRKVMVITGGARGVGASTARLAAQRGYAVLFSYVRHDAAAAALAAEITAAGGIAQAARADVAREEDVQALFAQADAAFGRLDVLINNAGVLEGQTRVEEMTLDRLERVFSVNVFGAFLCAREAVRRMSTRHGGSGGAIVNLSSRAAKLGSPGEYVDYAASKAAIDALTIGLAKEVAAEGIRVNAVAPGVIYTDIHASGGEPGRVDRVKANVPMLRGGQPEEVAAAALWLASDEASYVTGAILDVSGGR